MTEALRTAILNYAGWVVYTVIISNVYVFLSDAPGLIAATWMLASLYPLADRKVYLQLRHCSIAFALSRSHVGSPCDHSCET